MKRRAFTLIELLVVVGIIVLLAAILFPVFARARENARRVSCASNLKQIGLGIMQYVQDHDERSRRCNVHIETCEHRQRGAELGNRHHPRKDVGARLLLEIRRGERALESGTLPHTLLAASPAARRGRARTPASIMRQAHR